MEERKQSEPAGKAKASPGEKAAPVRPRGPEPEPGGKAKRKPARKGKPKAEGAGKRRRKSGRRELAAELARELLKLRPALRDVSAAVHERLDGQLVGLALLLSGEDLHGEAPPLPQGRVLESLLGRVRELKMKPRKARVKDLGRVDALLKAVAEKIPPGA